MSSITHKYVPHPQQREYNAFIEEYYSSSDVSIVFGENEETEIAYISYSLQEQLKPLFGYTSRTYDEISIGNRIVTGQFKVSIKNPNANNFNTTEILQDPELLSDIEQFNERQKELKDSMEWVNAGVRDIINGDTPNLDVTGSDSYEYIRKMEQLGCIDQEGNPIHLNSSEASIKSAVQKLQKEYNLDNALGIITDAVKQVIDNLSAK